MQMKEAEYFKICDKVDITLDIFKEKAENDGGVPYFPTVEDLKAHKVEENLKKYLPYLTFLDSNPYELEGEEVERTMKYIRKLLQKNLKIV